MGLISKSARDIAATWKACKFLSPKDDESVEKLIKRISDANVEGPPPKPRIRVAGWVLPKEPPKELPQSGFNGLYSGLAQPALMAQPEFTAHSSVSQFRPYRPDGSTVIPVTLGASSSSSFYINERVCFTTSDLYHRRDHSWRYGSS